MGDLVCFKAFCEKPAEYKCNCSFPQTFWCGSHLATHLVSSNNGHPIEAITKKVNINTEVIPDPLANCHHEHDFRYPCENSYDYPCEHPCDRPSMHPYEFSYKNLCDHPNKNLCEHSCESYIEPFNEYHFDPTFELPSEPFIANLIECFYKYPYEIVHKKSNPAIELTLALICEQISEIEKIKNQFSKMPLESSYSFLVQNSLKLIEQYNEVFNKIINDVECAIWNNDSPFSLIDIMNMMDNIKIEIEFLEKLNEILLLENQVKSCWLAKILESPEKINELISELIGKVEDMKKWCFQYKNKIESLKSIEDAKISSLINALSLISELINHDFGIKYFFQIKSSLLLIYGTESRKWAHYPFPFDQYNIYSFDAQVVELPNYKIFCLGDGNYAFIIDLKSWKITKIFPKFYGRNQSVPIYYENCVYIFCFNLRRGRRVFPCLEKFDLISNKKTSLPIPFIDYLSTLLCCLYKTSILICTEKSGRLCTFDLLIESYSEIPFIELYTKSVKMLFTGNMRAYIADNISGVFESEIDNEYSWNKIGLFELNSFGKYSNHSHLNLVSFPTMKNNSMVIYQFDLCQKKIYISEAY